LYSFTATASDADGDTLTFDIVGRPQWATFSASGVLSGTPGPGDVGTFANISIGVTDGKSPPVALPTFSITVPQPNRAPAISGAPATTVAAGDAYVFTSDGDRRGPRHADVLRHLTHPLGQSWMAQLAG
jgi:hypothetical protein